MSLDRTPLLKDLSQRTKSLTATAQQLKAEEETVLQWKADQNTWSVLECLGHLNHYGDHYLPTIEKEILAHDKAPQANFFKPGVLGNYFVKMMIPKPDGAIKKQKTKKDVNPTFTHPEMPLSTIDQFLKQQERWLDLFALCESADLTKIRIQVSFMKSLKIRLGDALRFNLAHNERHIRQAMHTLEEARAAAVTV